MTSREVVLEGGSPWGFRMHGGADQGQPLRISRVNPGSRAAARGVREGDLISSIQGSFTADMTNSEAHSLLRSAGPSLTLGLNQAGGGQAKRRGSNKKRTENNNHVLAVNGNVAKNGIQEAEGPSPHAATGGRGAQKGRHGRGQATRHPMYLAKSKSDPEISKQRISSSKARRLRKYRAKMRRAQEAAESEQESRSQSESRSDSGSRSASADNVMMATQRAGSLPLEEISTVLHEIQYEDAQHGTSSLENQQGSNFFNRENYSHSDALSPADHLEMEIVDASFGREAQDIDSLVTCYGGSAECQLRKSSPRDSPEIDNVEGLESFVIIVTEESQQHTDMDPQITIKEIEEIVVDIGSVTPKIDVDFATHPLNKNQEENFFNKEDCIRQECVASEIRQFDELQDRKESENARKTVITRCFPVHTASDDVFTNIIPSVSYTEQHSMPSVLEEDHVVISTDFEQTVENQNVDLQSELDNDESKKKKRILKRYPSIVEAYLDHKIKQYEIAIQRLDSPSPTHDRPESPILKEYKANVVEDEDTSWEFVGELPVDQSYLLKEFDVEESCSFESPLTSSRADTQECEPREESTAVDGKFRVPENSRRRVLKADIALNSPVCSLDVIVEETSDLSDAERDRTETLSCSRLSRPLRIPSNLARKKVSMFVSEGRLQPTEKTIVKMTEVPLQYSEAKSMMSENSGRKARVFINLEAIDSPSFQTSCAADFVDDTVVNSRPLSGEQNHVEVVFLEDASSTSSVSSKTLNQMEDTADNADFDEEIDLMTDVDKSIILPGTGDTGFEEYFDAIDAQATEQLVEGAASSKDAYETSSCRSNTMPDIIQDANTSPLSKWLQASADYNASSNEFDDQETSLVTRIHSPVSVHLLEEANAEISHQNVKPELLQDFLAGQVYAATLAKHPVLTCSANDICATTNVEKIEKCVTNETSKTKEETEHRALPNNDKEQLATYTNSTKPFNYQIPAKFVEISSDRNCTVQFGGIWSDKSSQTQEDTKIGKDEAVSCEEDKDMLVCSSDVSVTLASSVADDVCALGRETFQSEEFLHDTEITCNLGKLESKPSGNIDLEDANANFQGAQTSNFIQLIPFSGTGIISDEDAKKSTLVPSLEKNNSEKEGQNGIFSMEINGSPVVPSKRVEDLKYSSQTIFKPLNELYSSVNSKMLPKDDKTELPVTVRANTDNQELGLEELISSLQKYAIVESSKPKSCSETSSLRSTSKYSIPKIQVAVKEETQKTKGSALPMCPEEDKSAPNLKKNPVARMIEDFFQKKSRKALENATTVHSDPRRQSSMWALLHRPKLKQQKSKSPENDCSSYVKAGRLSEEAPDSKAHQIMQTTVVFPSLGTSGMQSNKQNSSSDAGAYTSESKSLYSEIGPYYRNTLSPDQNRCVPATSVRPPCQSRDGTLSPVSEDPTFFRHVPFSQGAYDNYLKSTTNSRSPSVEHSFRSIQSPMRSGDSLSRSSTRSPFGSGAFSPPPSSYRGCSVSSDTTSQGTAVFVSRLSPLSTDVESSENEYMPTELRGNWSGYKSTTVSGGKRVSFCPGRSKAVNRDHLPDLFESSFFGRRGLSEPPERSAPSGSAGSPPVSVRGVGGERRLPDGKLVFLSSPPLTQNVSRRGTIPDKNSRVLLCLSPAQRQCFKDRGPTPEECADLLDLHQKFIERRAYHESPAPPPRTHSSKHRRQCVDNSKLRNDLENSLSKSEYVNNWVYNRIGSRCTSPLEHQQRLRSMDRQADRFSHRKSKGVNWNAEDDVCRLLAALRGDLCADQSQQEASNPMASSVSRSPLYVDSRTGSSLSHSGVASGSDDRLDSMNINREPTTYVFHVGGKNKYEFQVSNCLADSCDGSQSDEASGKEKTFSSILKDKLFWKLSHFSDRGDERNIRHTPPRHNSKPRRISSQGAHRFDSEKYSISKQGDVAHMKSSTPSAVIQDTDTASVYEDLTPNSPYWQGPVISEGGHETSGNSDVVSRTHLAQDALLQTQVMPSPRASSEPSERPRSRPLRSAGVSDDERFREQMYKEYMKQVAERNKRREQKVIKISDPESLTGAQVMKADVDLSEEMQPLPTTQQQSQQPLQAGHLEEEFMHRVRERQAKHGTHSAEDTIADLQRRAAEKSCVVIKAAGEKQKASVTAVQLLPKHLQEFLSFTSGGVWSPGAAPQQDEQQHQLEQHQELQHHQDDEQVQAPPVWTPRSAGASPQVERKAFRPVKFESPILPRRQTGSSHGSSPTSPLDSESSQGLPRAPNPTVTLLQKAREGQIPRGAQYLDSQPEDSEHARDWDVPDGDASRTRKVIHQVPKKVEGLGPTTREGLPIALRSELRDDNKERWYKRMYDQLHKIKHDDDFVTVRYRPSRKDERISGRRSETSSPSGTMFKWPGGRTGSGAGSGSGCGYQSEPEMGREYATLDRRRAPGPPSSTQQTPPARPASPPQRRQQQQQHHQQQQHEQQQQRAAAGAGGGGAGSVTTPRSKEVADSLKYAAEVYKNQPGRIENYEPGKSSISDREAKQWWDEVLDIFDGMEQRNKENLQAHKQSFMNYALKESGYESDTQLILRRREDGVEPLSPAQQRTAYKEIQKGGDVPLHGLRKTAPEKPKDPEPEVPFTKSIAPIPKAYESEPELDARSRSLTHTVTKSYESEPEPEPESPHRYVDSEVTIHYRSPVSAQVGGAALSEEELSRRQAEAMRRLYQEERRRKYLHELQDINARRHTDNFTPSQKSPIPLNRYDDFADDYWSLNRARSRTPVSRLVARALYNFVGQTPRELSFRRGDIILVKRQLDKNWYEGEHNNTIGLFPFNYVEIVPYDSVRSVPKKLHEGQARAKFNFIAQTGLELSLAKGELVTLIRRVDDNWFEGRIGSQKGIFPVSYVEVLLEPCERPVSTPIPTNKPVASPAAHSLLLNGGSGQSSMGQHSYQPPTSRSPANYCGNLSDTGRPKQTPLAVNQTLHIDTHSDPVPYRALYNYRPQNDDELELVEGDIVLVMEKCDDGWYVGSSQRTGFFGTFPGNYVERI